MATAFTFLIIVVALAALVLIIEPLFNSRPVEWEDRLIESSDMYTEWFASVLEMISKKEYDEAISCLEFIREHRLKHVVRSDINLEYLKGEFENVYRETKTNNKSS